jgi:hypothetical protein
MDETAAGPTRRLVMVYAVLAILAVPATPETKGAELEG